MHMKTEFNIQALDSKDVAKMLRENGGVIAGAVAEQARGSLTLRRELLGGRV
jgi:hypothetical protein